MPMQVFEHRQGRDWWFLFFFFPIFFTSFLYAFLLQSLRYCYTLKTAGIGASNFSTHLFSHPLAVFPPVRYWYTSVRSPWAFSSTGWTSPVLTASPCTSDTTISSWLGTTVTEPQIYLLSKNYFHQNNLTNHYFFFCKCWDTWSLFSVTVIFTLRSLYTESSAKRP